MRLLRKDLLSGIEHCRKAKDKAALPILACVKISATNSMATMDASGGVAFVRRIAKCEGDIAPFCVDMDRIGAVLSSMSCENVEITLENQRIRISGDSDAALNVLTATEFPDEPKGDFKRIEAPPQDVSAVIQKVAWAEGDDISRPFVFDIMLRIIGGRLDAVATNRAIIACAFREDKSMVDVNPISFPARYSSSLASILTSETSQFMHSDNHVLAVGASGMCFVKKSLHPFPSKWDEIIGAMDKHNGLEIPVSIVEQACSSARALGLVEGCSQIVMNWNKKSMSISAPGQHGDWKRVDEADSEGSGIECPLNAEYMSKIVRQFQGTFRFTPTEFMSYFSGGDLKVAVGNMRRLK